MPSASRSPLTTLPSGLVSVRSLMVPSVTLTVSGADRCEVGAAERRDWRRPRRRGPPAWSECWWWSGATATTRAVRRRDESTPASVAGDDRVGRSVPRWCTSASSDRRSSQWAPAGTSSRLHQTALWIVDSRVMTSRSTQPGIDGAGRAVHNRSKDIRVYTAAERESFPPCGRLDAEPSELADQLPQDQRADHDADADQRELDLRLRTAWRRACSCPRWRAASGWPGSVSSSTVTASASRARSISAWMVSASRATGCSLSFGVSWVTASPPGARLRAWSIP